MKELELILKMLEADMAHVKEEYENFEDKTRPDIEARQFVSRVEADGVADRVGGEVLENK